MHPAKRASASAAAASSSEEKAGAGQNQPQSVLHGENVVGFQARKPLGMWLSLCGFFRVRGNAYFGCLTDVDSLVYTNKYKCKLPFLHTNKSCSHGRFPEGE
jgi:hypothetical protein